MVAPKKDPIILETKKDPIIDAQLRKCPASQIYKFKPSVSFFFNNFLQRQRRENRSQTQEILNLMKHTENNY